MNAWIRRSKAAPLLAGVFCTLLLAGCAAEEPAPDTTPDAAPDSAPADATPGGGGGAPEVFFTNMEDGGNYPTSYDAIFGVRNFNIVPIEDPLVVRPGEGHYHLAYDVACAAAGEVIVAGNPSYVHFGDGSDRITVQFEPGEHRLCLQVADGEHRVIAGPEYAGLTKEIRFTVQ